MITRHRIFSLINIFGLAASMSVGLLFIAILADVFRYDQFHEKKERIVRVTAHYRNSHDDVRLATSPFSLGEEIKSQLTEAEFVTTVGHGFNNEFRVGDRIQSLKGFWAQPSFFDVFTFPFLVGDPATALTQPNSIIITETAAKRIFETADVVGKTLTLNRVQQGKNPEFLVTGVLRDVPKFSQIQFEAIGSFATIDLNNAELNSWQNVFSNYTYVVLNEGVYPKQLQDAVNKIAENKNSASSDNNATITFTVQPLTSIVFRGNGLDNEIGPTMPPRFLWLISSLTVIILVTAFFNYTNLSIARAFARIKEIGIRKIVGARRKQVVTQFIVESTVIGLLSLVLAFAIFILIRPRFLMLTPTLGRLLDLTITPVHVVIFLVFAIATGLTTGLVPGFFFSKVSSANILRGVGIRSSWRIGGKKALIVIQYVFALVFITSTIILYKQYRDLVKFDLGFTTSNIVNINLEGNNHDFLKSRFAQIPEVKETSSALMVTSTGSNYYTYVKGRAANDSLRAWYNKIDENYLKFFEFKLIAGRTVRNRLNEGSEREAVVNQTLLRQLDIASGNPWDAVGQTIVVENNVLTIVGVVEDFHYSTLDRPIGPFLFRQLDRARVLNVKIESEDILGTMQHFESIWKSIDSVHPFDAQFYDHQIEYAYREYSSIGKVVGFLAFLTIVICSLGLLGMVVFTAETRRKEMSVRVVLGATSWNVTYLLSRNFLVLLITSMIIAIPVTWLFFTKIVLVNVTYHKPIGFVESFSGSFAVIAIALVIIVSQGLRVSRANPATVLRSE